MGVLAEMADSRFGARNIQFDLKSLTPESTEDYDCKVMDNGLCHKLFDNEYIKMMQLLKNTKYV
jgi:hypothetical protein